MTDNLAQMIESGRLIQSLGTNVVGREIRYIAQTGSTNEDLKVLARYAAIEGLVLTTDEQSAGRGRRGRIWLAPPGSSLLVSILLRPAWLPASDTFYLTMLAAVACSEAIEEHVPVSIELKWPNDIQIESRKLGGILVETELSEHGLAWAVVGMGLNVSWDPSAIPQLADTATSIGVVANGPIDRSDLLRSLLCRLDDRYARLKRGERRRLWEDWRARLSTLGQPVRADIGGETLEGVAECVTPSGALVVRDNAGGRHELVGEEVTVRRQ